MRCCAIHRHRNHPLSAKQASPGHDRAGHRTCQNSRRHGATAPVHTGIQEDGEQKISSRPGADNGNPHQQGLGVKRHVLLALVNRCLPAVQHPDIAAQGKQPNHKLGGRALGLPAPKRLAKADRKTGHLDTTGAGHPVMPIFMHCDQQRQCNEKSRKCQHASQPVCLLKARSPAPTAAPCCAPEHRVRAVLQGIGAAR